MPPHEIPQRPGERRGTEAAGARAGHARRICHTFGALALALAITGAAACARTSGWQRAERRACGSDEPPRLCLLAGPDAQLEVDAGGAALVPGECAVGPDARSGRVLVRARDGRSGRETARTLRVRRGETAMLAVVDGEVALQERRACAREESARGER
jgi:hypothetical protein